MSNVNFPKVYACYDTIKGIYIGGAKGQTVFDNITGLKLSISHVIGHSYRRNLFTLFQYDKYLVDEYLELCNKGSSSERYSTLSKLINNLHEDPKFMDLVKSKGTFSLSVKDYNPMGLEIHELTNVTVKVLN